MVIYLIFLLIFYQIYAIICRRYKCKGVIFLKSTHIIPSDQTINRSANSLFLYCFLAYAISYLGRQNFSACLPAMMSDEVLDQTWGGYISTAYMLFYGAGQLINGISGTRIKPHYMIGTGLLGAGCMNLLMGCISTPWLMVVIWSCNGLFHSMLWAPIIRIFTDRLPASKQYSAGVNIAPAIPVGTVLAYLMTGMMLKFTTWRWVFWVLGGVLVFMFLVWSIGHIFLRDYVRYMDEKCQAERAKPTSFDDEKQEQTTSKRQSLWGVLTSAGVLFVLPCIMCNGALKDAITAWVPTFFCEQFGMSESDSSLITVIVPVVSVSGAYVSTWLNKKFIRNEILTSSVMFGITGVCILGVVLCGHLTPILCAAFLAIGISSMWGASTMFLTMLPYHFAKLNLSSAITGFLNCFAYFSSAACTSVYGIVAAHSSWQTLTLVWLGLGIGGVLLCFFVGKMWGKRVLILDEGRV